MRANGARERPVDRLTVPEAAGFLGVTQSAIRKRIKRGTIPWDKDEEGRVFVYVAPSEMSLGAEEDKSRDTSSGWSRDELLEAYKDQVEFLRRELERKDTLLMSLMRRVPELEVASEPREAPEPDFEAPDSGDEVRDSGEKPAGRSSWWRRYFGV